MFIAKVTGSVVATLKVVSMVGRKLLTVEPLRVDAAEHTRRHGPDFCLRGHCRRRRRRNGSYCARLQRPSHAGDGEAARRRYNHRHSRHCERCQQDDLPITQMNASSPRVSYSEPWGSR